MINLNQDQVASLLSQVFGGEPVNFVDTPQPMPVVPPEPQYIAGLYCTKCEHDLTPIDSSPRRLFYCTNNMCKRFGIVVVIAKTKKLIKNGA